MEVDTESMGKIVLDWFNSRACGLQEERVQREKRRKCKKKKKEKEKNEGSRRQSKIEQKKTECDVISVAVPTATDKCEAPTLDRGGPNTFFDILSQIQPTDAPHRPIIKFATKDCEFH